jgi:hypothetical protein
MLGHFNRKRKAQRSRWRTELRYENTMKVNPRTITCFTSIFFCIIGFPGKYFNNMDCRNRYELIHLLFACHFPLFKATGEALHVLTIIVKSLSCVQRSEVSINIPLHAAML